MVSQELYEAELNIIRLVIMKALRVNNLATNFSIFDNLLHFLPSFVEQHHFHCATSILLRIFFQFIHIL